MSITSDELFALHGGMVIDIILIGPDHPRAEQMLPNSRGSRNRLTIENIMNLDGGDDPDGYRIYGTGLIPNWRLPAVARQPGFYNEMSCAFDVAIIERIEVVRG